MGDVSPPAGTGTCWDGEREVGCVELCVCSPYRNMAVLTFFNACGQFADDLGGCASELIELGDESFGDGALVLHHLPEFPIVDSQVYCEAFNEVEAVFHPCLKLCPGK